MRQRVTYLLSEGDDFDLNPADIQLSPTDLVHRHGKGVEERRITLGLTDLPQEIRLFLEAFHEVHFRLVSNHNYPSRSPAVSRLPAGLHVFFTPGRTSAGEQLCARLTRLFGDSAKCGFSKPPILSERFASAATYQYYHGSPFLMDISESLGLCPENPSSTSALCDILSAATSAAYVDYDYDAISHALDITILSDSPRPISAAKLDAEDRLEVGILKPEKPTDTEDLSLAGYLTVVGEDDHPSATLFSFPARHHPLPPGDTTTFSTTFQSPTGLHPKMDLTFPSTSLHPPRDGCSLHAYSTLPSHIFIDRYQFSDPLFLASHHLVALRSLTGAEDLEAPDWAIPQWGSAVLFELAHPHPAESPPPSPHNWTVTIPMHLRYVDGTGSAPLSPIPFPVVFWACGAEEHAKMGTNPFDRVNVGYDGLVGKAMFYHVPPAGEGEVVLNLEVPVMVEARWAGWGTGGVVLVAFLLLWAVLWRKSSSVGREMGKGKGKGKTN